MRRSWLANCRSNPDIWYISVPFSYLMTISSLLGVDSWWISSLVICYGWIGFCSKGKAPRAWIIDVNTNWQTYTLKRRTTMQHSTWKTGNKHHWQVGELHITARINLVDCKPTKWMWTWIIAEFSDGIPGQARLHKPPCCYLNGIAQARVCSIGQSGGNVQIARNRSGSKPHDGLQLKKTPSTRIPDGFASLPPFKINTAQKPWCITGTIQWGRLILGGCDGFFRLPEEKKSSDTLTKWEPSRGLAGRWLWTRSQSKLQPIGPTALNQSKQNVEKSYKSGPILRFG